MPDPTTWKDVGLELVRQLAGIIGATAGLVWAFRRYVKPKIDQLAQNQDAALKKQDLALANQKRIEEKADGQHEAVREEIKKAGRYEGAQEAKQDSRIDREQIVKAVEQVLVAQSKLRGRRRSDG